MEDKIIYGEMPRGNVALQANQQFSTKKQTEIYLAIGRTCGVLTGWAAAHSLGQGGD